MDLVGAAAGDALIGLALFVLVLTAILVGSGLFQVFVWLMRKLGTLA